MTGLKYTLAYDTDLNAPHDVLHDGKGLKCLLWQYCRSTGMVAANKALHESETQRAAWVARLRSWAARTSTASRSTAEEPSAAAHCPDSRSRFIAGLCIHACHLFAQRAVLRLGLPGQIPPGMST